MNRTRISALLIVAAVAALAVAWRRSHSGGLSVETVGPSRGTPVIMLLHGFGAAGDDLLPLANDLAAQLPGARVLVPAAPHSAGPGRRSWVPRISAPTREEAEALAAEEARRSAAAAWKELLAAVGGTSGCGHAWMGGFSQGGRVALHMALNPPAGCVPAGVMVLSGGGLDMLPPGDGRGAGKLRAMVAHGNADPVVPFTRGRDVARLLASAGHDVRWMPFNGPHTIPPVIRGAMAPFIRGETVGEPAPAE